MIRQAPPPELSSPAIGRAYRRLWAATACSALGTGMTAAAIPMAASGGANASLTIGFIYAAGRLPGLLFAIPAGLVTDRFDRRQVLITADIVRAVVLAVAAVAVAVGTLPAVLLALLTFLVGAGETVFVTAAQSALPSLVPAERLDHANGRLQAAEDVGREFAGPPLGSFTFHLAHWVPFVGDSVSYGLSALLLRRLPATAPHPTAAEVPAPTAAERRAEPAPAARPTMAPAWQFVRGSRALMVLGTAMFVLALCGSAVLAQMVLIVRDHLRLKAAWFGPALTVLAVGATLAAVAAGPVREHLSARSTMVAAVALNAASYLLLGASSAWPVALMTFLAWGFAVSLGNIASLGIRQRTIPSELLGRTMGLFRAVLGGGGLIGSLGSGVLAQGTSPGTVATIAGIVQLPVIVLLAIGLPDDGGATAQGPAGEPAGSTS